MFIVTRTPRPNRTRAYSHVSTHAAPCPSTKAMTSRALYGSPSVIQNAQHPTVQAMRN